MIYMLVFYLILLFIFFYFVNQYFIKSNKEKFENQESSDSPYQQYLKLSPNIIDNICPPNPDTTYSFKINENYCTSNLFCPNKTDLCVNNHCVPQNIPFPPSVLQQCNGCPKPGLI